MKHKNKYRKILAQEIHIAYKKSTFHTRNYLNELSDKNQESGARQNRLSNAWH